MTRHPSESGSSELAQDSKHISTACAVSHAPLWNLLFTFFEQSQYVQSKENDDEQAMLVREFNLVFEDMIDSLIGDLVEGIPTLRPHLDEPTMQTPIDASSGTGGDGQGVPASVPTPVPTPTPTPTPPTPPTPPNQSQVP